MKKYVLKTKGGDVIACLGANSREEAEKLFSFMKNLEINDLLTIFIIEEKP